MKKLVMDNKKGSNVGLVVSFMIFVIFVLFVVTILQPVLNTNDDKKSLSLEIEKKIIEKTSDKLTTITISIKNPILPNCVSISSFVSDFNVSSRIIIKSNSNETVSGSVSSLDSNILQINRASTSDNFFKIYSGSGFDLLNSESLTCQSMIENSDYKVGVVTREDYIFESKVISIMNSYLNYSLLKSDLGIPKSAEAEISFEFGNGTVINTGNATPTTNIFADEKPVEYISNSGDLTSGKIITRIW